MLRTPKILLILMIFFGSCLGKNFLDEKNYTIKQHHEKLGFTCKNCHKESDPKDYKALSTNECLSCHKSYSNLAELSAHLGYDDNIHSSPHYPKMDCNICHKSHKQSTNYCVMCHSQDSMKKLLVP